MPKPELKEVPLNIITSDNLKTWWDISLSNYIIGLGNMGRGMAANLVSKGHSLVVYDVNTEAVSDLGNN